ARFNDGTQIATRLRGLIDDGTLPAHAIVPTLVFPGAVGVGRPTAGPAKFFGAPVIGVDPEQPVPYHVIEGADLERSTPLDSGVLVGATIAQRLRLKVGDPVNLRVLYGGSTLGDPNQGRFATTVR